MYSTCWAFTSIFFFFFLCFFLPPYTEDSYCIETIGNDLLLLVFRFFEVTWIIFLVFYYAFIFVASFDVAFCCEVTVMLPFIARLNKNIRVRPCVCECVCVRACVHACVRTCVRTFFGIDSLCQFLSFCFVVILPFVLNVKK